MSRSPVSPALAIRSAMLLTLLAAVLSACVQAPPVFLTASDCERLIPTSWKAGVPSAALPAGKSVGEWVAFADAQTGQLDIANGRFQDATEIRTTCELLLRKAGEQSQPKPWYKIW